MDTKIASMSLETNSKMEEAPYYAHEKANQLPVIWLQTFFCEFAYMVSYLTFY